MVHVSCMIIKFTCILFRCFLSAGSPAQSPKKSRVVEAAAGEVPHSTQKRWVIPLSMEAGSFGVQRNKEQAGQQYCPRHCIVLHQRNHPKEVVLGQRSPGRSENVTS